MRLQDHFRQLFLLLWKNFSLKRRQKLRALIEIIWPLFLFLILMWIRTRDLTIFRSQCHFAERPLPSSGAIPFLRGYFCELNNSCSNFPRDSYTDDNIIKLTNLASDAINSISSPQVREASTTSFELAQFLYNKRLQATVLTGFLLVPILNKS